MNSKQFQTHCASDMEQCVNRLRFNGRSLRRNLVMRCTVMFLAVLVGAALIGGSGITPQSTLAQDTFQFDPSGFGQSGGIDFGGLTNVQEDPVTLSAKYYSSGGQGRLEVEATLGQSWHIYSTTQPKGGPLRTTITVKSPESVKVTGDFVPAEAPSKSVSDTYPGVTIEEHEHTVLWTAPIDLPSSFKGKITVQVNGQVCQTGGSCIPIKETLTAALAGPLANADQASDSKAGNSTPTNQSIAAVASKRLTAPESKANTFRDEDYEVTWTTGATSAIAPGGTGQLIFRAVPQGDFHVYAGVTDDTKSSTNFVLTDKAGLMVGAPQTDEKVISKSLFPSIPGLPPTPPVRFHDGRVTWALPIKVPADAKKGQRQLKGFVCYQACTDKSCLQPMAMEFTATISVGEKTVAAIAPLEIKPAKFVNAINKAAETKWVDEIDAKLSDNDAASDESIASASIPGGTENPTETTPLPEESTEADASSPLGADAKASLPFIMLLAFCGGFILNFMPCVLPVIGIKVLSFVQQAGEDRKRVAALNFSYVAGIMTVFAGLAVLAVVFSFGWGQQFGYFPVRLGLTVVIFALALSYLGVWELPTPGLATGKSSEELQNKEGLGGAFFTGVFATILATPCSGPFLGVALGYTLYLNSFQSVVVIMTVGLGMALPYVLLGLFPAAVKLLPKPGNWMVTLKEFLAFLFLGTVAYFFNQFRDEQKLSVFVTLIGVWFGCWVIGKVPPWESIQKRMRGWSIGVASAVLIGWFGFAYLEEKPDEFGTDGAVQYIVDDHLRWEEFDTARLDRHLAAGKTVMLDFTAAWCPNCITNTEIALDTAPTKELLKELDAVPMLADMTDLPEDIVSKLENEFGSKSIPLLAIYPGQSPEKPIVLRDIVTQSMVLDALRQAGPSLPQDGPATDKTKIANDMSSTARQLISASPQPSAGNH